MLQSPTRRTISLHSISADSHLLSNLSTYVLSSFRSRKIRPRPFISPSRKSDRDRPHREGDRRGRWFRWAVNRRPAFKLTYIYWVPGTFPRRRDGIHRPSIVVFARSSPPPEAHFHPVSRRSFVDNGFRGGMFMYP